MTEFHLGSAQRQCHHCQQGIQPLEIFFSTVQITQDQILRREFCISCWNLQQNLGIYWKTKGKKFPEKVNPPNIPLLWEMFWASQENSPYLHYFLGLVLMRRREIDFIKTIEQDGKRYLILRAKPQNQWLQILDFSSETQELERIQQELYLALPDVTF
ncbi:MAG: hypothetical protein AABZ60_20175 [Planctomycetota bacterium]